MKCLIEARIVLEKNYRLAYNNTHLNFVRQSLLLRCVKSTNMICKYLQNIYFPIIGSFFGFAKILGKKLKEERLVAVEVDQAVVQEHLPHHKVLKFTKTLFKVTVPQHFNFSFSLEFPFQAIFCGFFLFEMDSHGFSFWFYAMETYIMHFLEHTRFLHALHLAGR